jgi:DNA-binding MarR family transcriptional regulator
VKSSNSYIKRIANPLHEVIYKMSHHANAVMEERKSLDFSQFKLLMMITEEPEFNQKTLADCVGITQAGMSKTILNLEKKGIIVSQINKNNRRERRLVITELGQKLLQENMHPIEELSDELFSALTTEEVDTLEAILHKLLNRLNAV